MTVSWKRWCLGNPGEVPKLKYLIQYYNQEAIFLRKTLIHANKIEGFCYLSGFVIVLLMIGKWGEEFGAVLT